MFSSMFTGTDASGISAKGAVVCIGVSIALGFLISIIYMLSERKKRYSPHFAFTLVILPAVVCSVIMLVGSDKGSILGRCVCACPVQKRSGKL